MGSTSLGNIGFDWTGTPATGFSVCGLPYVYIPSGTLNVNQPTPAQTTHASGMVHGAEHNPSVTAAAQGYNAHFTPYNSGLTQTVWPLTMSPGDFLVKTIGTTFWSVINHTDDLRIGMLDECAALFVTDEMPGAEAFMPSVVGWAGRPKPTWIYIDTNQWADLDACVASLPNKDVSSFSGQVPTFAEAFSSLDQFAFAYGQLVGANSSGGYQALFPYGFASPKNYGVDLARLTGACALLLTSNAITASEKKQILIRMIQHGIQWFDPHRGNGSVIGGNGAHHQFHQVCALLYLHFTGQDTDDLTTYMPGNVFGQIFEPTQNDINTILQPHTDPNGPMCSHERSITAVNGLSLDFGSTPADDVAAWFAGSVVKRVSDGATAYVNDALDSNNALASNIIDVMPSPPFTTSDKVIFIPLNDWIAGPDGAEWLIQAQNRVDKLTTLALGRRANYRNLQYWSSVVLFMKAMGIKPAKAEAVDNYVARCNNNTNYPPNQDWELHHDSVAGKNFAQSYWLAHYSSLSWAGGPSLQTLPSGSVNMTVTVQ